MQNNNLFDKKWTFLDTLKIFFLIVSAFSTWNIVDMLTPDTSLAFIREIAAVAIVEGTFIGFEAATWKAKSDKQVHIATIGFFCSITVIGLFAATSGVLEFGGPDLLDQSAGAFLGLAWTAKDAITAASLGVFVIWLVALASLFRIYELNDPDKRVELAEKSQTERVTNEGIRALEHAVNKTKDTVARTRAKARIEKAYGGELTPDQLAALMGEIEEELATHYDTAKAIPADPQMPLIPRTYPAQTTTPAPLRQPAEGNFGFAMPAKNEMQYTDDELERARKIIAADRKRKEDDALIKAQAEWDAHEEKRQARAQIIKIFEDVLHSYDHTKGTTLDILQSGDCEAAELLLNGNTPSDENIRLKNGPAGVGLPCFRRDYLNKKESIGSTCAVCGFNRGATYNAARVEQLRALVAEVEKL